jgi:hypothetical protein
MLFHFNTNREAHHPVRLVASDPETKKDILAERISGKDSGGNT